MENYYQKYKLSSLYFGAYYSGNQYFFPSNTLSELDFNRYNNPYYIDFLDLPKTGIISLFNYLEPIYDKANISGSDKIYSLPSRTDTINVDLAKIKRVYAEKNSLKDLKTSINYFGNNLSFVLDNPNLNNFEWSNEEDLNLLINRLNFAYSGNIDYANGFQDYGGFYGRGYLLQNCSGCIDTTELIKISGSNASLNCQDCLLNEQYDVIKFSINLNYNIYNLLNENDKKVILNSEKIDPSYLSKSQFITFTANDKDLQDVFSITSSKQVYNSFDVCESVIKGIQISAGNGYSLAVLSDGSIAGWGLNDRGQIDIPAGIEYNGVEVSAGTNYSSLALLKNGRVTGWGVDWSNGYNSIPRNNRYAQIGNRASGVSEGFQYSLVLLKDGTVTGWGNNSNNQALGGNSLTGVSKIRAGYSSLALLNNGRITGWGDNSYYAQNAFNILTGVIDISSAANHSLALLNNGRITGWGDSALTSGANNLIGITGIKSISAGTYSSIILFEDGRISGWGFTIENNLIPPNLTTNIAAVSPSKDGGLYEQHILVLLKDGTITGWGDNTYKQVSAAPNIKFCNTILGNNSEFYRDKNYLPLFFRNLNLNSKKLVPFVEDQYDENYVLNESGYKITSYKYVPNIDSQKVFGSRIIDENSILSARDVSLNSYSKTVYDALFSGNEVYQYGVSQNQYIPQAEQIEEKYFKYSDICGNYYLIPRRPVQIRLTTVTGREAYLNQILSSGANLGYSLSINGSGDTIIATAPNATFNNVQNAGLIFVVTGNVNNWGRAAKLTGWDSAANDQFGFSSCINKAGTVFAIGAPNASINNISGAGAVYIFTGKNENWSGISKITGSSSYSGYKFGSSLSMNSAGNVLIAGAPRANNLSGSAYIFTGNGNAWKEYNKINKKMWNYPVETGAYFGYSVSMNNSGNLVAIGAPNENISGGFVYIYTGDSYNNKNWNYADSIYSQANIPIYTCGQPITGAVQLSAGFTHGIGVLLDGRVISWGSNYYGESYIPPILATGNNAIAVAANYFTNYVLLKDGTVTGWSGSFYEPSIYAIPPASIQGNVTGINGGAYHTLALLKDGTVTGWGNNDQGQINIPTGIGTGAAAIAAGGAHSLALLKDGRVTGWGYNNFGQTTIPTGIGNNAFYIAAGSTSSAAILKNGKATGWGADFTLPGLGLYSDINNATGIAISKSDGSALVLLQDGTLTGLGIDYFAYSGFKNISNVAAINAGFRFYNILLKNGTVTGLGQNEEGQANAIPCILTGFKNTSDNYFGYSLDLNSGNILAVGAPGSNNSNGSCSIFNLNVGNITKTATLSGSINSGFFGASVALNLSGTVLIASSPFADISGNDVVIKAAGLSSAFINKTGWELYNTRSNFLSYEYLGSSIAINDTGNVIVLGAIGTTASNGNVNAGNYYISVREQTCPNVQLLDENPVENYTIPNIKVQLDSMDGYSFNQDQPSITYWKNKVNFGKGYNNLYNNGDAITFNSDIQLVDIEDNQFSGLLDYNNPRSGDYISFDNKKFIYPIDFSGITGLNNLINANSLIINKINSKIINDTTLLLSTSGLNDDKEVGASSLIKTNYLSGTNQGVVLASYYSIFPSEYLNFIKIANDVQNIYACRHSETGEIDSSYRRQSNNIDFNLENEYFLAILKNGKITGFGTNYSGRLLGTTQEVGWNDSPVGKITGAVKLSLGSDFALALLDNKRITGWGNNFSGKATLGNNLTGVIDISAGGNHSLALLANGNVTGWGDDTYGQAFGGNILSGISGISAGWLHSLALFNISGIITGWGYNEYGQASGANNVTGAKEISAGKFHSLAILNSGNRITGWGDDYFNQMSDIHKITYSYAIKFSGISQTTNKGYDIFLLNNSGTITGLGTFSYYQQLQGITLTGIRQISNSPYHVMMVNNLNKITGFGYNNYYQISSGFNLTGVSEIGVGDFYTVALLKNGRVTGWGDDTDNQALGGNYLTGVKAISVGAYHSLAILNDNTLTGWGNNIYGQSQNGNGLTGVSGISAGRTHSLALLNDGAVIGWGDDTFGQASFGNSLTGVVDISAGDIHSLALLKNGKVTGWGYNLYATGGNNLTGVLKISAGDYNSIAILNDKNSVTGWGDINTLTDLFNITSIRSLGPTGFSGISAGLFSSYAYSGDNKKISNFGQQYLNIDSLPKINSTVTQLQQLPKYNFAQGVNFAAFIIENQNSGSMNISKNNIDLKFNQSGYSKVLLDDPYTFDSLKSGKYSYSLTGSGFYNAVEKYPDDDSLLPKYETAVMLSSYFTNMSTMIITGYTGSLPISLFFVEYGLLNSDQKTIQSYKNTGCYISTLNTGKLINLTGIGDPIKVNEPFYSDIQVGNLIMDTGRFEYYINNRLIYTGSTGFNFGQIVLGNNYQYTGVQAVSTYTGYPANLQPTDLTGIQKGFNGNLFEILIYNSALNELNRNEIFYYLTNKWQTIANYYPSTTVDLTNRIIYNEKTKTNCSDCSPLLNSLPKQNEPHILLFEYNLYGYSGTMIQDCDLDMQVYILKTGFYEESRKEPLVSNLDVAYISGFEKSISTISARSQNVYNVADFNFGYNKIPPSQDRLKTLQSTLELQQPIRNYSTGEYLKYPKIDGNGI